MAKDITVNVNGMVCDFCAQSLKKVFLKEDGVQGLDISLENKTVIIQLDEEAEISDEKINELIEWAGYETAGIVR
jgi:copper chaperone CopZ